MLPFHFRYWDSHQPDEAAEDKICAIMNPKCRSADLCWHDRRCSDRYAYICKAPPKAKYAKEYQWHPSQILENNPTARHHT